MSFIDKRRRITTQTEQYPIKMLNVDLKRDGSKYCEQYAHFRSTLRYHRIIAHKHMKIRNIIISVINNPTPIWFTSAVKKPTSTDAAAKRRSPPAFLTDPRFKRINMLNVESRIEKIGAEISKGMLSRGHTTIITEFRFIL